MKAYAPLLCNNILIRAERDNIKINLMKLQKILYYVCVQYVKQVGISPISESFYVWKTGPVCQSVQIYYRSFKENPINVFWSDAKNNPKKVHEDGLPTLTFCLEYVWSMLKHKSCTELARVNYPTVKTGGLNKALVD